MCVIRMTAASEFIVEGLIEERLTKEVVEHYIGGDSIVSKVKQEAKTISCELVPAFRVELEKRITSVVYRVVMDWIANELGEHEI